MLNRRKVSRAFLAGMALNLFPAAGLVAQTATPDATPAANLAQLLPGAGDLPTGLEVEHTGMREEIAQLAGTFHDSREAAQLLADWGWVGNAYRSYAPRAGAGSATPARVEISLHQFASSTGAAYALSYFAHDRAVALRRRERLGELLLPCEAIVTGGASATRFFRRGNLVVRVTVVMPQPGGDAAANAIALATATDLALVVAAKAGGETSRRAAVC